MTYRSGYHLATPRIRNHMFSGKATGCKYDFTRSSKRVLCWDHPVVLHDRTAPGQQVSRRTETVSVEKLWKYVASHLPNLMDVLSKLWGCL